MPNAIFINDLSNNIIYDFLSLHCPIENDYYVIDKLIYKKFEYNTNISEFFDLLKNKYKKNKQFYLNREINYNNLLTVLRHICKYNNIPYFSKMKYDKNNYYIIYYIKKL